MVSHYFSRAGLHLANLLGQPADVKPQDVFDRDHFKTPRERLVDVTAKHWKTDLRGHGGRNTYNMAPPFELRTRLALGRGRLRGKRKRPTEDPLALKKAKSGESKSIYRKPTMSMNPYLLDAETIPDGRVDCQICGAPGGTFTRNRKL